MGSLSQVGFRSVAKGRDDEGQVPGHQQVGEIFASDVVNDLAEQHDGLVVDLFFVLAVEIFHLGHNRLEVVDELLLVSPGEGVETLECLRLEDGGAVAEALHQKIIVVGVKDSHPDIYIY